MKIVASPDDYSFEEQKQAYAIHNDNVRAYNCHYVPAESGRDYETIECDSALEAYNLFLENNMFKNKPVSVQLNTDKMIKFEGGYGVSDPSFYNSDPDPFFEVEFDDHIKDPSY